MFNQPTRLLCWLILIDKELKPSEAPRNNLVITNYTNTVNKENNIFTWPHPLRTNRVYISTLTQWQRHRMIHMWLYYWLRHQLIHYFDSNSETLMITYKLSFLSKTAKIKPYYNVADTTLQWQPTKLEIPFLQHKQKNPILFILVFILCIYNW